MTRPTLTISPPSSAERAAMALRTWEPGGTGEPSGDDLCALISERLKAAGRRVAPPRRLPGRASIISIKRPRVAAMSRVRAQPKHEPYAPSTEGEARIRRGNRIGCWQSAFVISDDGGSEINVRVGNRPVLVERHRFRLPRKIGDPPPLRIEPIGDFLPVAKGDLPPIGRAVVQSASSVLVKTQRGVMRPQPKDQPRIEDPRYRRFVRQHPCISCGGKGTADNPIEASHHGPGVMGGKPHDSRCVPLCRRCHIEGFHVTGRLPGFPLLTGDSLDVYLQNHMLRLLGEYFWGAVDSGSLAEERLAECLDSAGPIEAGAEDGP